MKLSLIIPAYNEAHNIVDCLNSVAAQTVMPDEVIVVDNNSTDETANLARQFDFVKVVKEERQGRGFARSRGFSEATGDILGRIDADSRLDPTWVEQVRNAFESDSQLAGLTGIGRTSFLPFITFWRTTLFSRGYFWYVHAGFRTITMWGANMAIRAASWRAVEARVCNDDSLVHEDQDISLWIAAEGGKILQDDSLRVTADGQAFINLKKALHYRWLYRNTRRMHIQNGNLAKLARSRTNHVEFLLGAITLYVLGGIVLMGSLLLWPLIIAKRLLR